MIKFLKNYEDLKYAYDNLIQIYACYVNQDRVRCIFYSNAKLTNMMYIVKRGNRINPVNRSTIQQRLSICVQNCAK